MSYNSKHSKRLWLARVRVCCVFVSSGPTHRQSIADLHKKFQADPLDVKLHSPARNPWPGPPFPVVKGGQSLSQSTTK